MEMNRLKHLYVEELKDLYSAENQLLKALPKMAKAATSEELSAGFEEHLEQTKGHVERLEKIFKALGESPKGKKCKGMEGLISEGAEVIEEDPEPEELDAGLDFGGAARGTLRNGGLRKRSHLRETAGRERGGIAAAGNAERRKRNGPEVDAVGGKHQRGSDARWIG